MDTRINIKVEAEQLNPSENLIQQELDWQGCFSENSEVTHSSSSNVNNEGLKLHIKQEKQTVPIKEELVILSEINYYDPQDEPLDQSVLNSFLWPSYLKKEIEESVDTQIEETVDTQIEEESVDTQIEESVDTQEKSGEKSQFNEILKSKNPIVLLEDVRHTHKKILEQYQSEDYRKKLRQKRPREECSFHEKSMNTRKKLGQRLSKTSVSRDSTDDGDLEKRSNNNESKVSGSRNEQNNSNEKNKNSVNFKLKSNSSLETFKKDNLNIKKFECNYCSYKTKYERSYNAHFAKHKNVKLFKCNSCDFETNYESGLIRHNLKHCSETSGLNSAKNCDNQLENPNYFSLSLSEVILLIYNKRKLLDENISIPSPAEPIKCSECNFEAEDQNCLDLHSQIHSEVHKCPECSYKSTDTETFKDHLIKIHLGHSTSESASVPYSLRKRSKQPTKTGIDESSDEDHSEISGKHKSENSDFEDELIDITEDYDEPRRKKRCNYATRKNENFVAPCLDHANEKVFKCDHCDFKTNFKRSLRNHKLNCIKNQENILRNFFNIAIDENVDYHSLSLSEIINLICNQDKSLDHNTFDDTTTEVLKCLECMFETGNQKIFNLHSQIHVECKKCPECKFESKDADTFKDHLISHFKCDNIKEQKVRGSKKRYLNVEKIKCSDCSYKTKNKESFDAHCAKHKNIKLFKCDDCDFESNYRSSLIRHSLYRCAKKAELSSSKNCVVDQSKNTNYCSLPLTEIMFLIYNKRKSLDENASVPSPTEPLKCSECDFETEGPRYFEFHSQIHSEVQNCPECGYESTDTRAFKNHLITHLGQSRSDIESVSYSFRKKSEQFRKTLVDMSSDEEQNEISVNNKNQDSVSDFEDEMSNGEMDTRDNNYLRRKKKFRCHDCSYTTWRSENFVAHCLDHIKEKLFKCEFCDFKTNYRRTIKKHNLKCIKNQENSLSECSSIAIDENVNYQALTLSETINLICSKDKSLDINTIGPATKEVFRCLECTFETGNQKTLDLHSQIHVEVKKCAECKFESKDTETFKDHLITHLDESRSDVESVPYFRKKSIQSSKTIKEYYSNEEHREMKIKKKYACDVCDFKTEFYPRFVSHLLLHNKDKSDCSYISTNLDNLKVYTLSDIISMICNDENEVNQDINLDSETKLHKCSQCIFECSDEEQFSLHLSSHSTEKKFICSQCSFEGTNQSDLDSHLQTHSTIKCSKCLYEFSDIVSWNLHRCELKSDKVFKCLRCNFETKKKKHFTLHSQIHAKLRKCTECDYSHLHRNKFHHHLMTHLPKKLYSCTECGYKTNLIHKLKVHFLNHAGKKVFHCPKCDYKTNHKDNLRHHIENHFEFKSYRCSECNYSTSRSRSLRLHILDHSQKKLFLCSECDYGCNNETRMSQHVLQHSREKLYKCSRCDFETNYMKNLKDHEARRHGGSFSYACSHCDFKCYKRSSLKDHSVIHSNTKLLKCPECSYECKKNLKLHMINMHSKTKMYKCSQCKYEGNHRSNFLTHIRTHSNERKYSCSECSFACNRKDNLKVHMTTHLKEKLSCAECSYKCSNKQQLKRHILSH